MVTFILIFITHKGKYRLTNHINQSQAKIDDNPRNTRMRAICSEQSVGTHSLFTHYSDFFDCHTYQDALVVL